MKVLIKNNKKTKINKLTAAITLGMATIGMLSAANANVVIESNSGWETSINGSIPVFVISSDHDNSESALRVGSGFNPANLNFNVSAPTINGLTVSGHFQIDTHLNAPKGVQNGGLFESRIAKIQIGGDFGTITVGKDFGVFNSSAIGDKASQGGVGWLGGGADTGNATGGRIGTGYVYANFNPQVKYASNNYSGFEFKIALINPEEPQDSDIESDSPRFEAQINYSAEFDAGSISLWTGFLQQNVSVEGTAPFDYDLEGVDVGTKVNLGNFSIALSYTDTTGIGADGLYGGTINDADVDATQWYVEAYYTFDQTTVGYSYGEGHQDSRVADASKGLVAVAEVDNELSMLFVHHQLTPQLRLVGELQDYKSDVQDNYDAIVVGFQYDF